jgi:hypothetical protein
MPAEWYYTTNKQQMGPVSWNELRELVESGIVKPHDMVWTEGMDEWVKAIQQQGLFDDEAISEAPTKKKSKSKPPPGRRKSSTDEEEDDDEEDEREAKRKARKAADERAKTGVYVKVGLIVGGIVLFLTVCVVCGGIGVWWVMRDGGGGKGPDGKVRANYTISNLRQGGQNDRRFNFTQGRRVVITVTNTLGNPNTDVDLHVFRGNAVNPFLIDVRVPREDRHCRLEFVVPASDSYKVQVVNLGPGTANSCAVSVEEH